MAFNEGLVQKATKGQCIEPLTAFDSGNNIEPATPATHGGFACQTIR